MIAKVFGILEKADEAARAVTGVTVDFARGLAADVRRTKGVILTAGFLASEIGWFRTIVVIGDALMTRLDAKKEEVVSVR